MILRCSIALFLLEFIAQGVVVDRIAIIVGQRAVKTSDIENEARIKPLLNGDPLDLQTAALRQAAERLIDQAVIRREIELGGYASSPSEDVDRFFDNIRKQRFKTDAAYQQALTQYGIAEAQLKRKLAWQLTVLNFIERRFRPGVLVTNEDVERYFKQHYPPAVPLESVRKKIEDQIAGDRVNELFERWLGETRTQLKPEYVAGAIE